MKNVLILGFGRSGTSLMGGILHHSGYYMGDNLYPPRESNPKGFFENEQINGINEKILSNYDHIKIKSSEPVYYKSSPYNPIYGQRWLSYIDPNASIECVDDIVLSDIKRVLGLPVFAYKDPRFNYTLPIWSKYFSENTLLICMFRQPEIVVESVLKDCNSRYSPDDFYITRDIIYQLWYNNYYRILNKLFNEINQQIIFVHYEQLLAKNILSKLSRKLEITLNDHFVTPDLNRSRSCGNSPQYVVDLYTNLCRLSKFSFDL